jgi:hypothetical protein
MKNFVEQLLAVPEEQEVWFEDETCSWLLPATEAPGTPKKVDVVAYHNTEHGVTVPMGPPAETSPPILENAGQPLK